MKTKHNREFRGGGRDAEPTMVPIPTDDFVTKIPHTFVSSSGLGDRRGCAEPRLFSKRSREIRADYTASFENVSHPFEITETLTKISKFWNAIGMLL